METSMGSAASTTDHSVDDLLRVSPELVLVDPALSERLRPRLPLVFLRSRPPLPSLGGTPILVSSELHPSRA
jgi:hypothetical protein